MEPTTVIGFVTALTQAYADGLNLYTRWKRARMQQNHYGKAGASSQRSIPTCALSTSLEVAGPQIKETYDIAFAIVGTEFSTGDAACRDGLRTQLSAVMTRVITLRAATSSKAATGPLDLAEMLQVSEAARVAAVHELRELYQRFAASRQNLPRDLPVPKPRSRQDGEMRFDDRIQSHTHTRRSQAYDEDDRLTTAMTISSDPLRFQSEPPSPPPTPKIVPDDADSTWGGGAPSEAGGPGGGPAGLLRPKNSVFSIFCPEAMTLQVDPKKTTPGAARRCKCGYRWRPPALPDRKDAILLKEGFRMTGRFLAKSHCGRDEYGCVLCTSTGRTDTYASAEALRVHINATHTKWQMLHDRDMT